MWPLCLLGAVRGVVPLCSQTPHQSTPNPAVVFHCCTQSTFVSFDVSIGTETAEQLVFQLDKKTCPITTANFVALAVGAKPAAPPHLGFLDTIFHRVQEGGWAQGGDINSAVESGSFDLSGTGGEYL